MLPGGNTEKRLAGPAQALEEPRHAGLAQDAHPLLDVAAGDEYHVSLSQDLPGCIRVGPFAAQGSQRHLGGAGSFQETADHDAKRRVVS